MAVLRAVVKMDIMSLIVVDVRLGRGSSCLSYPTSLSFIVLAFALYLSATGQNILSLSSYLT